MYLNDAKDPFVTWTLTLTNFRKKLLYPYDWGQGSNTITNLSLLTTATFLFKSQADLIFPSTNLSFELTKITKIRNLILIKYFL